MHKSHSLLLQAKGRSESVVIPSDAEYPHLLKTTPVVLNRRKYTEPAAAQDLMSTEAFGTPKFG